MAARKQASAEGGSSSSARSNSKNNQQLLQAIFANRNEPDLYKSLQETNRRAAADAQQAQPQTGGKT